MHSSWDYACWLKIMDFPFLQLHHVMFKLHLLYLSLSSEFSEIHAFSCFIQDKLLYYAYGRMVYRKWNTCRPCHLLFIEIFFMCANTFCKWKYVNKEDKDKTFIMFYFLIKDDYSVGIEHYLGKIQVC